MKSCTALFSAILLLFLPQAWSQLGDHLSPDEIKAAIAEKPGSGFVEIMNPSFGVTGECTAQVPEEFLYTPEGWLNARSNNVKSQYLAYNPEPADTLRALTVISRGCALGTPAGPTCDSITRVVLLSDKGGSTVVEAIDSKPIPVKWQNGFGATAACTNLISKFSMIDIQKVRNAKGEFLIATFSGSTLLKTYTVKEKFIKKLGL